MIIAKLVFKHSFQYRGKLTLSPCLPVKPLITVTTAILTPNRTVLLRFAGLSGKTGRSSDRSYSGETY